MRWTIVILFALAACGRSALQSSASAEPEPQDDDVAEQTFLVTAPTDGATVSGTVLIDGEAGAKWINVAAYIAGDVKVTRDATPRHNRFSSCPSTRHSFRMVLYKSSSWALMFLRAAKATKLRSTSI